MAATGTVPGTGRAAGTAPEAGPVAGMVRAGRAIGMGRANTPGMARRRVPAVNRSTAEADRQRRRRPIASTGRDRAASPTTDCKGRARPAFLIREGQRSDPGGPVMSPQQLKPTSPRSIPAGVSCESKSTDCPGCDPERAYARRLRGRSPRPAALGRHALSAAPRRRLHSLPAAPWRQLQAASAASWRRSAALSPPPTCAANAATPTPCTTPAILGADLLHPGIWSPAAFPLRRQAAATPWRRPVLHHQPVSDGAVPRRGTALCPSHSRRGVESASKPPCSSGNGHGLRYAAVGLRLPCLGSRVE